MHSKYQIHLNPPSFMDSAVYTVTYSISLKSYFLFWFSSFHHLVKYLCVSERDKSLPMWV